MYPFNPSYLYRVINLQFPNYFIFSFGFLFEVTGAGHPPQVCAPEDFILDDGIPPIDFPLTLPVGEGLFWESTSVSEGTLRMAPNASTVPSTILVTMQPETEEPVVKRVSTITGIPSQLPQAFPYVPKEHGVIELVDSEEFPNGAPFHLNDRSGNTRKVTRVGGTPIDPDTLPLDISSSTWYTPDTPITVSEYLRTTNDELCVRSEDDPPGAGITFKTYQGIRTETNTQTLNFGDLRITLEDIETAEPEGIIWRPLAMHVPTLLGDSGYRMPEVDIGLNVQLYMQPSDD